MIYVISTIRLNRLLVYLDAAVDRARRRIEGEHIAERVAQDGGGVNLLLQGADFLADCLENIVQIARIRRGKIVVAVLRAVAQIPFPIRMMSPKIIITLIDVACSRIVGGHRVHVLVYSVFCARRICSVENTNRVDQRSAAFQRLGCCDCVARDLRIKAVLMVRLAVGEHNDDRLVRLSLSSAIQNTLRQLHAVVRRSRAPSAQSVHRIL